MRVLLDTQVMCLAAGPGGPFPEKVESLLADQDNELCVSAASLLEIAIKNSIGKLRLSKELLRRAVDDLDLEILPVDAFIAYQLYSLPLNHCDPFDRIIIATALQEDIPLVAGDRQFRRYNGLKLIW